MSKTKVITRTAAILALAIIFQNLRYLVGMMPNLNLIIGSLVNLCIIIAVGSVGLVPALIVCLVTPIVALVQLQLPHVLFVPVTMLGNSALAISFYFFVKSRFAEPINSFFGIAIGAVIKWGIMYWLGIKVVLNLIAQDLEPKQVKAITAAFSIPQLFTALIGGVLGIIVIKALNRKKSVD